MRTTVNKKGTNLSVIEFKDRWKDGQAKRADTKQYRDESQGVLRIGE